MSLHPGDEVIVVYTGYTVRATVIGTRDKWVEVEQLTDFEDVPAADRPTYLAAEEYVCLPGEPLPPCPMLRLAANLGYDSPREESDAS